MMRSRIDQIDEADDDDDDRECESLMDVCQQIKMENE
jgi:hypothetical protein